MTAWTAAFRLPEEDRPLEGAERPRIDVERVDTGDETDTNAWSLRVYRQTASYALAQTLVSRRVIATQLPGGAITGCLVHEEVLGKPEEERELRLAPVGDGVIELTDLRARPKPKTSEKSRNPQKVLAALGVMSDRGAHARHVCTVADGLMGCVSLTAKRSRAPSELSLVEGDLRFELAQTFGLVLGAHEGPYRVPLRPGVSSRIRPERPRVAEPFGSSSQRPPQPRFDVPGLATIARGPACIAGAAMETAEVWAEQMLRGEHSRMGRFRLLAGPVDEGGSHGPDGRFVMYPAGLIASREGGHFTLDARDGQVTACALMLAADGALHSVVSGSYEELGPSTFRYRIRPASASLDDAFGGLSSSGGSSRVRRRSRPPEREVLCHVGRRDEERMMGCVHAPADGASISLSPARLRWRGSGESFTLTVELGDVQSVVEERGTARVQRVRTRSDG